mmetsp:Transcript_20344/g.30085  ORF Transcript_20344/g.30085 Transcript_20344/m.30085 type:complete len:439 (+) Transcript_20344:450-1766(+)|eukprot:CAMPEP_0171463188 /NCGR_PEP_ID=MMETSP0945-20130129/6944_1 /TAXON_ID=109269 /ORGANISM="Vaucheria litorea, Strain CCMP2940" /LENGTH=438 /DNA_ID=CAMNT_0011989901 /DNA_START=441 /DNA_END=1757 /DNA_ORIENTATION=+
MSLRRTTWNRIGYGAAKCFGSPDQIASLKLALDGGVNVIDTSANFKEAKSEKMIGQVLSDRDADDVTVVSKFGYWVDSGEKGALSKKVPPGSVDVLPGIKFCLEPEFMRGQLKGSTERLGRKPDFYLVHNPETFVSALVAEENKKLGKDGENRNPDPLLLRDSKEITYEKLQTLFQHMEGCVSEGLFGGFGVSSHGFALPVDEPLFMDWNRMCGNQKQNGLKVIQMPGNLLELEGIRRAPLMRKRGLKVMLTRPLSLMMNDRPLLNVKELDKNIIPPKDYIDTCREFLEHFSYQPPENREPTKEDEELMKGCDFMHQLIEDMNNQLGKFESYEHVQQELAHSIIPLIDSKFEELDEMSVKHIQKFFDRYGEMVQFNCSELLRGMIQKAHDGKNVCLGTGKSWVDFSLEWLQEQEGVDTVLVGMHQPSYVESCLKLIRA